MKRSLMLLLVALLFVSLAACGGSAESPTPQPGAVTTQAPAPAGTTEIQPPQVTVAPPTATSTPLPSPTPTPEPQVKPGLYLYSNPNEVRGLTLYDGKLWAATLGGVVAWDLATDTPRKYTTLAGLPHLGAYGITVCPVPEPRLIVGTAVGLSLYDPATDRWMSGDAIFKTNRPVGSLLCDAEHNRLIMKYDDVTIVDLKTGTAKSFTTSNGLAWMDVTDMVVIGDDLWLASGYNGVSVISLDNKIKIYSQDKGNLPARYVYAVEQGLDGTIWLGAREGLIRFDPQNPTLYNKDNTPGFPFFGPEALAVSPNSTLWLGFSSEVREFNPELQTFLTYAPSKYEGMATGSTVDMFFDDRGALYYHTYKDGVSYFDGTRWHHLTVTDDLPTSFVDKVFQDQAGTIWVIGEGAFTTQAEEVVWTAALKDVMYSANGAIPDPKGGIWLAGGNSLTYFDGTQATRYTPKEGLIDAYIRSVGLDAQGRVWVGAEKGLSIWDGKAFTTFSLPGVVGAFLADGDVMWVGTSEGLMRFQGDQGEIVVKKDDPNLPATTVTALAKLSDGRLVIGTSGGLAFYDGKTVTPVPDMQATVSAIAVAPHDELWVTSSEGMAMFGKTEILGGLYHFDGKLWSHLVAADGLPSSSMRAVWIDSLGTIWAGGGDTGYGGGVVRIVP